MSFWHSTGRPTTPRCLRVAGKLLSQQQLQPGAMETPNRPLYSHSPHSKVRQLSPYIQAELPQPSRRTSPPKSLSKNNAIAWCDFFQFLVVTKQEVFGGTQWESALLCQGEPPL